MEFCGVSRFYWAAESYLVVEVLVFTKTLSVAGSCSEDRKKKRISDIANCKQRLQNHRIIKVGKNV